MTVEGQFLFDNQLIAGLENLIRTSKYDLLLVSPFIDLDSRIKDALKEKINNPNFKLRVLFGKNEGNIYRSIKNDSLEFLKQFPNVEIRYNDRLHAKYYQNDTHFLITSLNLYDYSLANNIECGFLVYHTSKGFLSKVYEGAEGLIDQGVSSIKSNLLGYENNEIDPLDKFKLIYDSSELRYKSEAILRAKKGIGGFIGNKEIENKSVIVDTLNQVEKTIIKKSAKVKLDTEVESQTIKVLSSTKISKKYGVDTESFITLVEEAGYVKDNSITELGFSKGLVNKSYMGKEYIAFPENLVYLIKNKI